MLFFIDNYQFMLIKYIPSSNPCSLLFPSHRNHIVPEPGSGRASAKEQATSHFKEYYGICILPLNTVMYSLHSQSTIFVGSV